MVSIEVRDVGEVVGQVFGHFGKHAIIQIAFYDVKTNWNQSANDRALIQGSFQFDLEAAYNAVGGRSKGVTDSGMTESIAERLLGVVIAGLLVGVPASLIAILFRTTKNRDRMQSNPNNVIVRNCKNREIAKNPHVGPDQGGQV